MKYKYFFLVGLILLSLYTYSEYRLYHNPLDRLAFLNVGQGDATLLTLRAGPRILIDCGPDEIIIDRLQSKLGFWTRRLDLLIVSHGDKDHFGGCEAVLDNYQVGKVIINGVFDQANQDYMDFLRQVKSRNIQILPAIKEMYISFNTNLEIQVLNPQENLWGKNMDNDNPESIVLKMISPNKKILLTGDMDMPREELLIQQYPDLDIDVLKAGHHGSKTATGDKFLEQLSPQQVIISAGKGNIYNHPHPDLLKELVKRRIEIIELKDHPVSFDIFL